MRHLRARPRATRGASVAGIGTTLVHATVVVALFGHAPDTAPPPPTVAVRMVAAPEPTASKPAPRAVQRPSQRQPSVPTALRPPRHTAAEAPPPPKPQPDKTEAAPRTTPPAKPLPDEKPSTGEDAATVETEGVAFEYPEYLNHLITEVYRRWQRPETNQALEAEIQFLIRRDGSISGLKFVKRSGNLGFDIEALGAIEQAGQDGAFGPLPDGYPADILLVSFFFTPQGIR